MSETQVGDEGVAHLAKLPLVLIVLHKTRITDAGLRHLAGIKNLREIHIGETAVTDAGVAALKQALPELRVNR